MTMESNAPPAGPEIEEAARLWAIRVQDPQFADWDGFTEWLERNPAHLSAYETALDQADRAADLLRFAPAPAWEAESETVRAPSRRWFVGGAVAAALALAVGLGTLDRGMPAEQIVTAPGERRTLELADGSRVILNGDTQLTIDADSPRHVELAQGEALFEIRHDESDPFVVVTGETRLVDAGTVFNVVADGGALEVEVAEGAVIYQPDASAIRLDAGDGLRRASAGATPVVHKANAEAVGAWQTGELHYDGASLDRIARDLGRNLGRPVEPTAGTSSIRFSGTLILDGEPEEVLARAGPLLGVTFTASGKGWTMSPANGPPR
jgi:transmembrane sensor